MATKKNETNNYKVGEKIVLDYSVIDRPVLGKLYAIGKNQIRLVRRGEDGLHFIVEK